jgi:hypothetical protein
MHHKVCQKIQREGILSNSYYEASITLLPKPSNVASKSRSYRPITLRNTGSKILNKISETISNNTLQKVIHTVPVEFMPGMQGWYKMCKSIIIIQHINRIKD